MARQCADPPLAIPDRAQRHAPESFSPVTHVGVQLKIGYVDVAMKFLVDTNVLIPLEPAALSDLEPGAAVVNSFVSLAFQGAHTVYRHPASHHDIQRDTNAARRRLREIQTAKYPLLPSPPVVSESLASIIGDATFGSNDWVDHQLLAAVVADAVDYLVTDDLGLRRKARRINLSERVLAPADALGLLRALFDEVPPPLPEVTCCKAHTLNESDPIFDSIRLDYANFDTWLRKCKREHRDAWLIHAPDGSYAAVCILKREEPSEVGLSGRCVKVCTLKVNPAFGGRKYGELLLKSIFLYCAKNSISHTYLTVYPSHPELIALIEEFGFAHEATEPRATDPAKELRFVKSFRPSPVDDESLSPLDFHRRYGPPALKPNAASTLLVPIRPRYHRLLFPDAETQVSLGFGGQPFGNALRKAYLCHSPMKDLPTGATLLFYRSKDLKAVTAIGVLEQWLRSDDADAIARFVGLRTVYSYQEIAQMCKKRPVVAILFRQDRLLERPLSGAELVHKGVMAQAPQSLVRVKGGGLAWVRSSLAA